MHKKNENKTVCLFVRANLRNNYTDFDWSIEYRVEQMYKNISST